MKRRRATVEARRKLSLPTTCNEAVGRDLFEPSTAQRILELVADTLSDEELDAIVKVAARKPGGDVWGAELRRHVRDIRARKAAS